MFFFSKQSFHKHLNQVTLPSFVGVINCSTAKETLHNLSVKNAVVNLADMLVYAARFTNLIHIEQQYLNKANTCSIISKSE
jgi:hypothetical protein